MNRVGEVGSLCATGAFGKSACSGQQSRLGRASRSSDGGELGDCDRAGFEPAPSASTRARRLCWPCFLRCSACCCCRLHALASRRSWRRWRLTRRPCEPSSAPAGRCKSDPPPVGVLQADRVGHRRLRRGSSRATLQRRGVSVGPIRQRQCRRRGSRADQVKRKDMVTVEAQAGIKRTIGSTAPQLPPYRHHRGSQSLRAPTLPRA